MDRIRNQHRRVTTLEHSEITEEIIGAAYAMHNEMGFGFLESVYESCMVIALTERGLLTQAQESIEVQFRGPLCRAFHRRSSRQRDRDSRTKVCAPVNRSS